MSVRHYKGKVKTEWFPVTTSTAFSKNSLVEWTSGLIAVADDNDVDFAGVMKKAIASTDSDYATARKVPVLVPVEKHVVWEVDAAAATFVAADLGTEFGFSTALLVDRTDTTNDAFRLTEVVSSSLVRGYIIFNRGVY